MYSLNFDGYFLSELGIPEDTGIYMAHRCIYDRVNDEVDLKEILYIGQSTNLRQRVKQHIEKKDFVSYHRPNETICYSYAPCDGRSIDAIENGLIYMQQPRANTLLKDDYHHAMPVSFSCFGRYGRLKKQNYTITQSPLGGKAIIR